MELKDSDLSTSKEIKINISPETTQFLLGLQAETSLRGVISQEGLYLAGFRSLIRTRDLDGMPDGQKRYSGTGIYLTSTGNFELRHDSEALVSHGGDHIPHYRGRLVLDSQSGEATIESIQDEFSGETQERISLLLDKLKPDEMEGTIPDSIKDAVWSKFNETVDSAGEDATHGIVRQKLDELVSQITPPVQETGKWAQIVRSQITDAQGDFVNIYNN